MGRIWILVKQKRLKRLILRMCNIINKSMMNFIMKNQFTRQIQRNNTKDTKRGKGQEANHNKMVIIQSIQTIIHETEGNKDEMNS